MAQGIAAPQQQLFSSGFAAAHNAGHVADRQVIAVSKPQGRPLPDRKLSHCGHQIGVHGGRQCVGNRPIPASWQRNPIRNGTAAQAVDDRQEPGAKIASSARSIPPGAQRGILHDIRRLVGAPSQVAREQEGRARHLTVGNLELDLLFDFAPISPRSRQPSDESGALHLPVRPGLVRKGNGPRPRYAPRTVTLRPSRINLWVTSVFLLVVAGGELGGAAYQILVLQRELGVAWFLGAGALFCIALVVGAQETYIQVNDSAITFGPKLPGRRSFDRREVARIRASHSPLTRRTVFLRSDGSTLYSTPGVMWGRAGLQRLADYLGVPLDW